MSATHPTSTRFSLLVGRIVVAVAVAAVAGVALAQEAPEDKPENPRQMFRALNVDDRYFDRLADGKPLSADETETLLRVLFRLRVFPLTDLERWALASDGLAEAVADPKKSRGEVFHLQGRVLNVEPVIPPADAAQRYEVAKYFRCRVELDSSPELADVYTENVPAQWQAGGAPDASVAAFGVFLKTAEKTGDGPRLVFAAPRLAWYPDSLLGELGMDFGLFDSVQDRKPVGAGDREAFYQMLAAVGRAAPGQLLEAAQERLPDSPDPWTDRQGEERYAVAPLFNDAAGERGQLVELLGTARRVERIVVSDADIVARFGIDHYYQVSLFTDDSEGNPLTFCLRELPKGMPYGVMPRYGETVRIAGFFFKTWSYAVPKMTDPALSPGDPKTHQQYSPLLIGDGLTWYPAPKASDNALSGVVVGGLFFVVMAILWLTAWNNRRRERRWLAQMESAPLFGPGDDFEPPPETDKDQT